MSEESFKAEPYIGIPRVEEALADPLSALLTCRASQTVEEKRVHARTLDLAAAIYAAAWTCIRDYQQWTKVVRHANEKKLLKRPIRLHKDQNRTMEKCARIVFQFKHTYDRAYKTARALDYCSNQSVKPEDVRSYIEKQGGIEKIYTRATKEMPRRGKTFEEQEDYRRLSREGSFFSDLDGCESEDHDRPARVDRARDEVRDLVGTLDDHVLIKVEPHALQKLLASEAGSHHLVYFRIGKQTEDGFVKLKADYLV